MQITAPCTNGERSWKRIVGAIGYTTKKTWDDARPICSTIQIGAQTLVGPTENGNVLFFCKQRPWKKMNFNALLQGYTQDDDKPTQNDTATSFVQHFQRAKLYHWLC